MYNKGDIIINKKSPTLILRVINPETKESIIVDSSKNEYIGKKTKFTEEKYYNKFEPKTQEDNIKLIKYKQKCKAYEKRNKEKVISYI